VPHGGWLRWLEDEFGWSHQTADRFISVSQRFDKLSTVDNLPALEIDASALYLLVGGAAPRHGAGDRLSAWR